MTKVAIDSWPQGPADVEFLHLNAFNLHEGAAFITASPDDENPFAVWIVMQVTRHVDNEMVWVWARRADLIVEGPGDPVMTETFMTDFNTKIRLVGHCLNPMDPDDNDWGN